METGESADEPIRSKDLRMFSLRIREENSPQIFQGLLQGRRKNFVSVLLWAAGGPVDSKTIVLRNPDQEELFIAAACGTD